MKYAALVLFCLGISSFVNAQERKIVESNKLNLQEIQQSKIAEKNKRQETTTLVNRQINGTVRTASCGTYIEVEVNGTIERYFPSNLNPKMHIDGYTISFDYVEDEMVIYPEACKITKGIRVNNVNYVSER